MNEINKRFEETVGEYLKDYLKNENKADSDAFVDTPFETLGQDVVARIEEAKSLVETSISYECDDYSINVSFGGDAKGVLASASYRNYEENIEADATSQYCHSEIEAACDVFTRLAEKTGLEFSHFYESLEADCDTINALEYIDYDCNVDFEFFEQNCECTFEDVLSLSDEEKLAFIEKFNELKNNNEQTLSM